MTKEVQIFDSSLCILGEGPIWHDGRKSLIWFDIIGRQILEKSLNQEVARKMKFGSYLSAAGIINEKQLFLAPSEALGVLDIETGEFKTKIGLEEENSSTRSNDGRTDPQGGFWIGTMGIRMQHEAGAIYRYFKGELRKLYDRITVPNSICFSPCGKTAYFTDTVPGKIFRVRLDSAGWPLSEPELFINCREKDLNADGSVIDKDDCLWNAQWGASRVARYDQSGNLLMTIEIDAPQTSCPAFGAINLSTLFITTARDGMSEHDLEMAPLSGSTFKVSTDFVGQKENRVLL